MACPIAWLRWEAAARNAADNVADLLTTAGKFVEFKRDRRAVSEIHQFNRGIRKCLSDRHKEGAGRQI